MTVRLGVIGLGEIAQKAYLPILSRLDTVEVAALSSQHMETVERICRQYRWTRGVGTLAELLRLNLDAAIVLTPSPTHYEIVRELLEAGLDVLVEKPATLSSHETATLAELAEQRGRVLMVSFNRRYAPLYRQAKDLLVGRNSTLCVAEKHRAGAAHPSLRANYIDDTIHMIDLVRWYGGEGRAVTTSSRVRDGKLVEAVSVVAGEGGGIGIVATSLEAGGWQERVTLHGERLTVTVEVLKDGLRATFRELRMIREDHQEIVGGEAAGQWTSDLYGRGFVPLLEHFVECVQTRQTPRTGAWEAYRTQVLLEDLVAHNIDRSGASL